MRVLSPDFFWRAESVAEIREVSEPAEVEAVARLSRRIWEEHYVPIIGQRQVDYMLDKFQSPEAIADQIEKGCRYFLLREGEEDVGYLALVPDREAGEMFLSKFYVRRDRRGEGLGRRMIEFTEELCREMGLEKIWLAVNKDNARSIRIYESLGFHKADTREKDIGEGFVMDDFVMEKEVG
jgi:ribosomal protein S18 acetylase RimI-like enzyme